MQELEGEYTYLINILVDGTSYLAKGAFIFSNLGRVICYKHLYIFQICLDFVVVAFYVQRELFF